MKRSGAKIHQTELLITLDYLLNCTDEEHPATQLNICKHAIQYDLKYNGGKAGDDIKRQRISETLTFLEEVSEKFPDKLPFVLGRTNSGKYYIEEKNGLNIEEVAKVLCSINERIYFSEPEKKHLTERIMDTFATTSENKESIIEEYNKSVHCSIKLNSETLRKIKMVEKAYKENRMIKVMSSDGTGDWYKVYLIQEINHKLYAFLLPIYKVDNSKPHNYIFDVIENISIANRNVEHILNFDEDENRDFDDLEKVFKRTNPLDYEKYHSLENCATACMNFTSENAILVSFYFDLKVEEIVKKSYAEFFNQELRYQLTTIKDSYSSAIKEVEDELKGFSIVVDDEKSYQAPKHGLANIVVDEKKFLSWMIKGISNLKMKNIFELIHILKPTKIYPYVSLYRYRQFTRSLKYLTDREFKRAREVIKYDFWLQEMDEKINSVEEKMYEIKSKSHEDLTRKEIINIMCSIIRDIFWEYFL